MNSALNYSILPSSYNSSLTFFRDFSTVLNTRHFFLQAQQVDEEPILAGTIGKFDSTFLYFSVFTFFAA
jgi:hypothetical protein